MAAAAATAAAQASRVALNFLTAGVDHKKPVHAPRIGVDSELRGYKTRKMSPSKFVALACLCFIALAAALVGAADDCSNAKMALFPCLDAVKGANPPAPSQFCCDGMKRVTKEQMCNCLLKSASSVEGINMDAAKAIPAKCGIPIDSKTCATTSH